MPSKRLGSKWERSCVSFYRPVKKQNIFFNRVDITVSNGDISEKLPTVRKLVLFLCVGYITASICTLDVFFSSSWRSRCPFTHPHKCPKYETAEEGTALSLAVVADRMKQLYP